MAFGILESSTTVSPPGTNLLEDLGGYGKATVILVPQPSSSPEDPLNWSSWRKELFFLVIVLGACGTGVMGPVLAPGFPIVQEYFNVSLTSIALLNGALIVALGVSSYVCTCLAPIYGNRLIYLLTTIILIFSCVWSGAATSYPSLLVSRVFQGLGMGAFFALAGTSSINDVFFVHQRGLRVGLWNFAVICSINIAPIISGYVITDLGWRWSFYLLAVFYTALFFLVLFAFPETIYSRDTKQVTAETDTANLQTIRSKRDSRADTEKPFDTNVVAAQTGKVLPPAPRWKKALGFGGDFRIHDQARSFSALVAPLFLLRHPAVIWGCAMWSVIFTWVIISATIAAQVFGSPPFNLSTIQIGNFIGVAPLIGSALGTVSGGWFSDWVSQSMAIRNKGVYEPEFRLLIMVPFVITWCVGAFGFGATVAAGANYLVCGVFLAILAFAVGVGCTGIVSYTNDVCQARAGESFGLAMLVKSCFAFGLTFMINTYYATAGPLNFMYTWGFLTVAVTLFTIPMYVYGKRIRAWAERKDVL